MKGSGVGLANVGAYGASKGAVIALTKAAALEVAAKNVRVNVINPSIIQTAMTQDSLGGAENVHNIMAPLHPNGRVGAPEEVAELVIWLCSERASLIAGAAINIDGGYTAQ